MDISEEYAVVLDFLPNGYPFDKRPIHRKTAIAQTVGTRHFTLLELVPKKDVFLQPYDCVSLKDDSKISQVGARLSMSKLTGTAGSELNFVINDIIEKDQQRFIDFFNKAQPLSTRMHQLELLPGVGKKHMWQIIEERRVEPFKSFEDIKKRVKLLPDPKKTVMRRILSELQGKEKYNIFVSV